MKLRNKKTGEVVDLSIFGISLSIRKTEQPRAYHSLADLNKEWEDYEPAEKKTKRYRLKKDLPTFNKGDEFYIAQTGALWFDGGGDDYEDDVCAYATQTLMKFPNILEEWFEEIKPKEPLIKDEKIRKAVRAWAKLNKLEKVEVEPPTIDCAIISFSYGMLRIDFYLGRSDISDGEYTVAELCGEEEEWDNGR